MSTTTTTTDLPAWKQKAAAKREQVYARIPPEWRLPSPLPTPKNTHHWLQTSGHLSPQELSITSHLSTRHLLNHLATSRLSAVDVVSAFSHRAALATQLIRCCTEMFFAQAIEEARGLDAFLAREGRVKGPLHGLPVSVKDGFDVEGFDSTLGWVSLIGKPAEKDATLVGILRGLGAVVFCKTNIPQSLMMSDSYNHIFKQSVNAFDNQLISGGSSGGEGALVGCRGSPIGIGTDIGGSIRIPAALQGLYGLSPTTGRVPQEKSGQRSYIVPPVAGPLAPDLATLESFMEALCTTGKPWLHEPFAPPIPWRRDLATILDRPLRIGYFIDDGYCRCQPPLEAAVTKAVEALRAAGHEVVKWDTRTHAEGDRLWLKAVLANGGKAYRAEAESGGEPTIPGMLTGELEDELGVEEGNELHKQIRAFQSHHLHLFHHTLALDALIHPTLPYVAYPPKTWVRASVHVGYTSLYNLLDWSALAVPLGVADPDTLDLNAEPGDGRSSWNDHRPRNESDRFNKEQYDPELVRGMPVGMQVVGGRYGEERCVAVAKALEEAVRAFEEKKGFEETGGLGAVVE